MIDKEDLVVPIGFRVLGEPTTDHPFCCCLGIQYDAGGPTSWTCSGVLIRPNVVLTAAHCGRSINRVLVGAFAIPERMPQGWEQHQGETFGLREPPIPFDHDDLSPVDLMLLILDRPSSVQAVSLATTDDLLVSKQCEVIGFGYRDDKEPDSFGVKRKALVPILLDSVQELAAADLPRLAKEKGFDPRQEFVAGRDKFGHDTCRGDSGGPALLHVGETVSLIGITARAVRDATRPCGDGGVYVRTDVNVTWIRETLSARGIACDAL